MQKLNILPSEIKNNLKYNFVIISLKNILGIFIITFSLATMAILIGNLILEVNLGKLTLLSSGLLGGNYSTVEKKIKSINTHIDSVALIKDDLLDWDVLIKKIINSTDKNIQINSLSINKTTKQFSLSGKANDRDGLLKFKESLEENDSLEAISLPLESLLEKYDINFSITGKLSL